MPRPRRDLVVANRAVSASAMRAEVEAGQRDLQRFRQDMERFRSQVADISAIPATM